MLKEGKFECQLYNEGIKNLRAKAKGKLSANVTHKFKNNTKMLKNPCGKLGGKKEYQL